MIKDNYAMVFEDVGELNAFLMKQTFDEGDENPIKKIFKAADGSFLVWMTRLTGD